MPDASADALAGLGGHAEHVLGLAAEDVADLLGGFNGIEVEDDVL